MKKLIFISNNNSIKMKPNCLYVTFSKSNFLKNKNNNIVYFFDIDHHINEYSINATLENNLFLEAKNNDKKFYPLVFKFIYKYYLTYSQFYNRTEYLVKENNIEEIEYSNNISFIFKKAMTSLSKLYRIELIENNESFIGFSYRHSDEMLSDIPDNLEHNNLFIYLYSKYLTMKNHKIFVFPSSFVIDLPESIHYFKYSVFNFIKRFYSIFTINKLKKYSSNLAVINFSKNIKRDFTLDKNIWKYFRDDQIDLIEHILNIFFNKFNISYLTKLQHKIELLLSWSKTKAIIIDETVDSFRRIVLLSCYKMNVKVEYLPHGIISEGLQFPFISSEEYKQRYIPKVLAWNNQSSEYFMKNKLESIPITYPINISSSKYTNKKDLLVLLSYGNRMNLNQFEEDIIDLSNTLHKNDLNIDWKTHSNVFNHTNKIMQEQKLNIEKILNTKLNFIDHTEKSSSIMRNYKMIIFTTYTTGIYEAALLDIPFIIFSKENENCHGINVSSLPIARNEREIISLLDNRHKEYLKEIRNSLLENIKLRDYLIAKAT